MTCHEKLRELLANATPGPWDRGQFGGIYPASGGACIAVTHSPESYYPCSTENEELIVAAVNALPSLIKGAEAGERAEANSKGLRAEVERLTAENNRVALERNAFEQVAQASQWSNTTLGAQIATITLERDRLREALELIAEEHDAGRHDGLPEPCPAHSADAMFAIARRALAKARGEV